MIYETLVALSTISILSINSLFGAVASEKILATHAFSLEKRYYPVQKENILLNLAYMDNKVTGRDGLNWDEVLKPQTYSFRLNPGEQFAFHDDVLPEYTNVVKTTNAHFNAGEGFTNAGYMYGDGVCHLASLIYWVALDADLETEAPTNHNFMAIPEIDKKYGVSIYSNPDRKGQARQNLYITNNKENPVEFQFNYNGDKLEVKVITPF